MISAIVPAAGLSSRMGRPKMLLPWSQTTVLGQVIETLQAADIQDVVVISGSERAEVEQIAAQRAARRVHNSNFAGQDMLASIRCGLQAQLTETSATLICLGDQPQMQEDSVRAVCATYLSRRAPLVVPSFEMHRGHPWLIARSLWNELAALTPPASPRDFLNAHAGDIEYVEVNTSTILQDLDTEAEYLKHKPATR